MVDNQPSKSYSLRDFFVFLVNSQRIKAAAMYEKALLSLEKSAASDTLLLSRLNETILRSWIDEMLPRLTSTTVDRYVESLHTIYKWALRNELATDADLFTHIKEYVATARREEGNPVSRYKVEIIRQLATARREATDERAIAIDAYLYAFYQAGMPMDEVIMQRIDSAERTRMPHTSLIEEQYMAPIRRYVFPLQQRQRQHFGLGQYFQLHTGPDCRGGRDPG